MVLGGSIDEICSELRFLLEDAVKRSLADGILLSGLDTSVLAVVASRSVSLRAFTVAFQGAPAPDIEYASLMARTLGIEHLVHRFDEDELYGAIPEVVKTLESFDPMEIRNSVAIYVALRVAKESGVGAVITGDGCDELLAGYSFLFGLEKEGLDLELRRLWGMMSFSSVPLAGALGLEVRLPYLDLEFKSFAMSLGSEYKVRSVGGQVYGKWILRKAFERFLPGEIAWRVKTPIEHGSGTTILPSLFDTKISDLEFDEERRRYLDEDGVIIRDKEQLFYYEIYRSVIGVPYPSGVTGKICPQCNSDVPGEVTYCRTCGAYPI